MMDHVRAWLTFWANLNPKGKQRAHGLWEKIFAKIEDTPRRSRWSRPRGPIGAIILTLLECDWRAVSTWNADGGRQPAMR